MPVIAIAPIAATPTGASFCKKFGKFIVESLDIDTFQDNGNKGDLIHHPFIVSDFACLKYFK
ncbi:hypothetical protein CYANOKiyG1_56040 [Okeania sp. KiyG1]|nr:hypothetical protein CYANOKiyG1_56040 [Okeania sp. KiyG1]